MVATAATNDFSTNRHSLVLQENETPTRHPDLCFNDGNIAILTGKHYFLVHKGLLCRHSEVLEKMILNASADSPAYLEGQLVLPLQDSSDDMKYFLQALYDGLSSLSYEGTDFSLVSSLLRLFTKYQAQRLRAEALRGLSVVWPTTLAQWEARETKATDSAGVYAPRQALPHPILVIKLARDIDAPQLLPSAFYDLSRCLPSDAALGHTDASQVHKLSTDDLLDVLRGREHTSRFLSTFIVNELEGREPSEVCINRTKLTPADRRACQIAFEAVTFELLRDVNGVVCNRNSDPLYAIAESELMQTRDDMPGMENMSACRACEACRAEFGAVVDVARDDFWSKLPLWFAVEIPDWG